jgi:Cu/Ag efflux protein CusF
MIMRGQWLTAAAILIAGLLAACGDSGQNTTTKPTSRTAPVVEIEDMRGQIVKLPVPENPHVLSIHHEPTKNMGAMTMYFTVTPNVPLADLAVGDKVAFRYEINLTARTELITKITKLPADTVLNFPAMSMPAGMSMPNMSMPAH